MSSSNYYQLGATGNRTNLSETVTNGARGYAWSYDALYRLTNETLSGISPAGTLGYGLDGVGNRTSRASTIGNLAAQTFAYNNNDWLTTTDKYDNDGNTATNGSNQPYFHDYEDRLTNFNNGQVIISYNADGQRVKKVAGGVTTLYLIDSMNPSGYPQVLEELGSSGVTNYYTYGLALISQRQPGNSTNFFIADGHASTRLLADLGKKVLNVFTYDAYGNLIGSNTAPQTVYLYAGQQWDADIGMYYNRARYYQANTGRFWTLDGYQGSSSDPASFHKYLYCRSDPANNIDPLGLWENTDFGNRIQEVITDDFIAEGWKKHVYRSGNLAIGTMVGFGPSIGPLALRPDLFQRDGKDNFFYEIKSATPDQIAQGLIKVALYNSFLNYYGPWRPGGMSDYLFWRPSTGPVITTDRNGLPLPGGYIAIVLPSSGGLMTYVKIDPRTPKTILKWAVALAYSSALASLEMGSSAAAVSATSVTISSLATTTTAAAQIGAATTITINAEVGVATLNAMEGGL